jgi:superfamily II DNA helicase RecQ
MASVKRLMELTISKIILTATLPPSMLQRLFTELNEVDPLIIRMSSMRKNIRIDRTLLEGSMTDEMIKKMLVNSIKESLFLCHQP